MTLLENNKRYFIIFVLNILPYHIILCLRTTLVLQTIEFVILI